MKSRVTITLDSDVHRRAKQAARARKTSVSGLIESLLRTVAPRQTPSLVDRMIGAASLREPAPGADPLHDALRAKYLRP